MSDFEREIQVGFLDEAKELLANAEHCFLNLENAKDDASIIEEIFRLAHNLKGSAGAVGFSDLKDFTHRLESLLLKLKNKEIEINSLTVNLLLQCNDFLVGSIEVLRANPEARHLNPELMDALQACIDGQLTTQIEAEATSLEPQVETELPQVEMPMPIVEPVAPRAEIQAQSPIEKLAPSVDENIRVSLTKIDHLLNIVGEIVILQAVVDQHRHQTASPFLQKTIEQMSKNIKEVQSVSMSLRMVALKQTFQKMQRIVRDTAYATGKEVKFDSVGDQTEVDKTVLEQLADPLIHLVRNAVDHGLESTEQRVAAGKPAVGNIVLTASQRAGQIVIEIRDDGKGLDPAKLIAKAKEKKILSANATLSNEEAYKLIFAPGFSTKEQVTDISGRGVGLDVVKTNIHRLKGEVEIDTQLGHGTCFRIVLPLTLAIIEGMVIMAGDERYVVPIAQIHESIRPQTDQITTVAQTDEVLNLRGRTLPLYRLGNLLHRKRATKASFTQGIALICEDAQQNGFAVFISDILSQQQVVIKSLGEEIRGFPGISGAAILGDGKASLILDLFELTAPMRRNVTPRSKASMESA